MAKKKRTQLETELPINMTPMIDVVFQLIIFFMLAVDLSQKELEEITLPFASEASEDENPEKSRMIININKQNEFVRKRQKLTVETLETELILFANRHDRDDLGLSVKPILIRADEITHFKQVQKVMQLCGKEGIKIWKIELAASEPYGEDRGSK
ncbi:MAG: biopolymer transporter ExbD [Planctomycetota bacterium]